VDLDKIKSAVWCMSAVLWPVAVLTAVSTS